MKKNTFKNPVAKSLKEPKYRVRTISDKRNKRNDKQAKKDMEDAQTEQDT